jgi:hypothetical protein
MQGDARWAGPRHQRSRCTLRDTDSQMPRRSPLSESEVEVLGCLVDGDEPTVLVVDMLNEDAPARLVRDEVERRLAGLEAAGLIMRARGQGADAKHGLFEDDWWRLTEPGWCALADSGVCGVDDADPLSGGDPAVRRALALLLRDGSRTVAELTAALKAAWDAPTASPPDVAALAPPASAEVNVPRDYSRLQQIVERRVGHLALDGVIAAEPSPANDGPFRWRLTDEGRAALAASSPPS